MNPLYLLLACIITATVGCAGSRQPTVSAPAPAALAGSPAEPDRPYPVARITDGEHACWFGYYDKQQVDASGRYALGARVGVEGRSPTAEDTLQIGMIDLRDGNRWIPLGRSLAWSWQQGCMVQWVPGAGQRVIWNDREGDRFVSRLHDVATGETRTLPEPIYAVAPNGEFAVGTAFERIQNLRPGYGYAGVPDATAGAKAPAEVGLYRLDLASGQRRLLIPISEMAALPYGEEDVADNWHWFNHLLVSPDSRRVEFLHRWRAELTDRQQMAVGAFTTRMITADADTGQDRYVVDPSGNSSHFVWRDPSHLLVWTRPEGRESGFWLLRDKTQEKELIGGEVMTQNGHNTYVPNTGNAWVLNDTYPDADRKQTLYLYHVPSGRRVVLGRFLSPPRYQGEWRCDLHPRTNQQGTEVFFDSTHEGLGRQMYRIDITDIIRGS